QRARAAEKMLRVDRLPVTEIAERLGFSGTSAFHRAFKRWFGRPPAHHRRNS
ncbi:MAG: helix-turn-helix domain-containing protein, partial [Archangium sp.]